MRSFFLSLTLLLFSIFIPTDSQAATSIYDGIGVAAIKYRPTGTYTQRIAEVTKRVQDFSTGIFSDIPVGIIVTPEYSFYDSYNTYSSGDAVQIVFDSRLKKLVAQSTGTAKSAGIVRGIKAIQSLAAGYRSNIILATIPEYSLLNGKDQVIFNSALIIDLKGQIIGVKRKTSGSDWCQAVTNNVKTSCSGALAKQAYILALASSYSYTLKTRKLRYFSMLPVICAERSNKDIMRANKNKKVDFLVVAEREGDGQYESLTDSIQSGSFNPARFGWITFFEKLYIASYVIGYQAVRPGGYAIISDGSFGQGGIVQLNNPPAALPTGIFRGANNYYIASVIL